MSSEPSGPVDSGERENQENFLNLDFVPTWARQPVTNPYANARGEDDIRPRRDRFGGRPRGDGRPARSHGDRDRHPPRGGRGPRARDFRSPPRPSPRLPLNIAFLPERTQLSALVRQLHAAQKAYPLNHVAHLLLAKPEYHLIKIEAHGDLTLWQFKPDGAVFLDPDSLRAHAIRLHLGQVFDETIEQGDPPSGNFNCVGRCTLSGEWLGPPNYHGYQERLLDLHRTQFPHLKVEEYRARIEMLREPAAIEEWKEAARTHRVYRHKSNSGAPVLSREEAVLEFTQKHLPAMQQSGRRFIMPAQLVRELPDNPLRGQLEEAWARESKRPFTMSLALRPAFKHMRLHLFKAGKGETFVTAIVPKPLDPGHAVENIRAMLQLIREHPGWKRAGLVEHLKSGVAPDSEEGRELLAPLRWLIEKGHVIEFFNGTLSAPAGKPASRAAEKTPEPEETGTDEEPPPVEG